MTSKHLKNVAASIRQRLLNMAKTEQRSFEELVRLYAMERFLYRLSRSPHSTKFILKGALMLRVWYADFGRPTMDIDMLGRTSNDPTILQNMVRDICSVQVEDDGLLFDPASVQSEAITKDSEYLGLRILLNARMETMRLRLQLDIGFGDRVYPSPTQVRIPTLLKHPEPVLMGYTMESAIAEKFHAMIELGELNSRMKDFYDVWMLAKQCDFDGHSLGSAIEKTFISRQKMMPDRIAAFSDSFIEAKQSQWRAFIRKNRLAGLPEKFVDVVAALERFLKPMAESIKENHTIKGTWKAGGPWQMS
ncbi:MAG: nucleotidyl transferase AbiEii/AbiGii toxin family protein [Desulfobacteraceae bacterium]|nr:MAG: nucleotidyl transferase AbiEii/AbiGii toxin family protein [Desulfobacteraceae bacterium]